MIKKINPTKYYQRATCINACGRPCELQVRTSWTSIHNRFGQRANHNRQPEFYAVGFHINTARSSKSRGIKLYKNVKCRGSKRANFLYYTDTNGFVTSARNRKDVCIVSLVPRARRFFGSSYCPYQFNHPYNSVIIIKTVWHSYRQLGYSKHAQAHRIYMYVK